MPSTGTSCKSKKNTITLKGSSQIVTEFLDYAVNSILYQRGVYPPASFGSAKNYGLPMQMTVDQELKDYLRKVLNQIEEWLRKHLIQRIVLVIEERDTKKTLERWEFSIDTDQEAAATEGKSTEKPLKAIQKEIQAIMRQIMSSVTVLPLLEETCSFDLLIITSKDCETPAKWEESGPRYIPKAETMTLKCFDTKIHKIEASVSYLAEDDDDDDEGV
eukprot:247114_1